MKIPSSPLVQNYPGSNYFLCAAVIISKRIMSSGISHFGMSIGFDDLWTKFQGRNNALRIDLAKQESNIFFTSPSRGSVSHFPIRPESFKFEFPAPRDTVVSNHISLIWEDSQDPDLYDTVNYLLLVDQSRSKIEQVLQKLETQDRETLVASLSDTMLLSSPSDPLIVNKIQSHKTFLLKNLSCGDYFWTVIAYDQDKHYRIIRESNQSIAQFTVALPDLFIQQITSTSDNCECKGKYYYKKSRNRFGQICSPCHIPG